jgi:D-alanine-D-alanine ligase
MSTHASSTNAEEGDKPPSLIPVLLLYNVVEQLDQGEARDLVTDQEVVRTAQCIAEGLRSTGHDVTVTPVRDEADVARAASNNDPESTLVFNLCENLGGRAEDEPKVPAALEEMGFQYTGSPARTLATCLNKSFTKAQLAASGVPTAPYQVFQRADEPIAVPLPAIVKPQAQDASIGIDRSSVVHDERALRRRVEYILDTYRQPALVEAFIVGREFNVGVWGNGVAHTLPLAEIDFSAWGDPYSHVVHFDAKWDEESAEYQTMNVICPAAVESDLAEQIRRVVLAAYTAMGCRDYARVDLRVRDGVPYVLEVNPNPCLATDGGFANAARVARYDYAHMAHQIATWAWWRRDKHP